MRRVYLFIACILFAGVSYAQSVTNSGPVCAGNTLSLSVTSPVSGTTYIWSGPDLYTATGASVAVTSASVDASGTYTVVGIAASDTTLVDTTTATVNPLPGSITATSFSVCAGGQYAIFYNTISSGTWTSTLSASAATLSPSGVLFSGSSSGTGTVTYTLPSGCYATHTFTVNPLPDPIGGSLTVCQAHTASLIGTPAGGIWTIASTSPTVASIGATGIVTGINSGNTTVTYTFGTGCNATATLHVNAQPAPITGDTAVCAGGVNTITLHDTTSGGSWSVTPSTAASITPFTGILTGGTAGIATVTFTAAGTGCTISRNVTVNPLGPPAIAIAAVPSLTVCSGTTVTYTASVTGAGTAPIYVWSVNGVIIAGSSSYMYVPHNGDVVRCRVQSSYTCAVPDTAGTAVVMTVNPTEAPSAIISTGMGDTVCSGSVVTFTAITEGAGSAPTYQWYKNTTLMSTTASFSYTPASGDIVSVKISSNYTCRTTDSAFANLMLTVSPPQTPNVSITSGAEGGVSCAGSPVTYTAVGTVTGYSPAYQWMVNGIPVGTGNTYTYLPATGDLLAVTMTSDYPCLVSTTASSSIGLTVHPVQAPVITLTASPGFFVPLAYADTFTAIIDSGGGTAPAYQWFKNGFPIGGATTHIYIAAAGSLSTGDSLACLVTNTDPCSGISSFQWCHILIVANLSVSQATVNNANISIVPNPNTGIFTIKGTLSTENDKQVNIEISDMLGHIIYNSNVAVSNGSIDELIELQNNIASGLYLVNVRSQYCSKVFHFVLNK